MDEYLSVLMLDVVSHVSSFLQLQGHLNQGTFFRVHFMIFKGFKMVGSLIFRCFLNLMAQFSLCISRGYWGISRGYFSRVFLNVN